MIEFEICSVGALYGTEVLTTVEADNEQDAHRLAEEMGYVTDDIMVRRKPVYAVIRVDQWYDHVEGVECLASFPTGAEAEKYVQEIKDERDRLYREKREYIDQFVERIEVPKTDYDGWVKFLKQFSFLGDRYVLPQDFKSVMKDYLREQVSSLAGFDPPPVKHGLNSLFVVEVLT